MPKALQTKCKTCFGKILRTHIRLHRGFDRSFVCLMMITDCLLFLHIWYSFPRSSAIITICFTPSPLRHNRPWGLIQMGCRTVSYSFFRIFWCQRVAKTVPFCGPTYFAESGPVVAHFGHFGMFWKLRLVCGWFSLTATILVPRLGIWIFNSEKGSFQLNPMGAIYVTRDSARIMD